METDRIKGLDWETGCKGVNNDEKLFLEVLRTYYEEGQEIIERYQGFQGEDIERTIIDMHGMKSASAGIGARELSEEFKSMEVEGKTGNTAYLTEHMEACMDHLKELTTQIKSYLDENGAEEKVSHEGQPEETLETEVLDELIEALDDIEFELFEEKIALLRDKNFGQAANDGIAKADRAYENFDYDDARDALVELKGFLN